MNGYRFYLLQTVAVSLAILVGATGRCIQPKQRPRDQYGDLLPPRALARMGTVRFRLVSPNFVAMTFSPDGKMIASIDDNGKIHLWDIATGQLQYEETVTSQRGEYPQARSYSHAVLAFSPSGKMLIAGMNYDGQMRGLCMWDIDKRKEVRKFADLSNGFVNAAVSPDFKHIAALADGKVQLWNIDSGERIQTWEGAARADFAGLAFSSDGKSLAFAAKDRTIHFCTLNGEKETILKSDTIVASLAFSNDGKWLASGVKRAVILFSAQTGELIRRFEVEQVESGEDTSDTVAHLAFSPDDKSLVVSILSGRIELWDTKSGKRRVTVHGGGNAPCAFSADNQRVGAAGHGRLFLWKVCTGEPLFAGHDTRVQSIWFSLDDALLISCSAEKVCFWDAHSGKCTGERVVNILPTLSTDTRLLVGFHEKGNEIRVRETATGKTVQVLKHKEPLYPWLLSPDGKLLVVSSSGQSQRDLFLWDVVTGKELWQLGDRQNVESVAFSSDGKFLADVDPGCPPFNQPKLRVWDVQTGKKRMETELGVRMRYPLFSPDNRLLLASDPDTGEVCVYETATGRVSHSWQVRYPWDGPGVKLVQEYVDALALSPDGRTLATGCMSRGFRRGFAIQLWDVDTGEELQSWEITGKANISALAFSHDGKRLASTGEFHGNVIVWDVDNVTGRPKPRSIKLTKSEREELWERLADGDAMKARNALVRLARTGGEATQLIGGQLKELPVTRSLTQKRFAELLTALDNDNFETREKARKELENGDATVANGLRKHLKEDKVSLDVQHRIEGVIEQMEERARRINGPVLQWLRVVEVLERIGTPEARDLLTKIAASQGPIADDAKASLERCSPIMGQK